MEAPGLWNTGQTINGIVSEGLEEAIGDSDYLAPTEDFNQSLDGYSQSFGQVQGWGNTWPPGQDEGQQPAVFGCIEETQAPGH
jgi:hypothetical protein